MGVVKVSDKEKHFWTILFLAGLIAGLILRFYLVGFTQTPGHGDPAFYYTVAKNLVDGRGFVVDYIAYYFQGLVPITHYSNDFWNPLTSVMLAIPMKLFGKSVFNALIASMTAGLVIPIVGYLAAKHYSNSEAVAVTAGLLTYFAPIQVWGSVATDSNIFFGAFGVLALYVIMLGGEKPKYYLVAAFLIGLTSLTRNDGVLLLTAAAIGIFLSPINFKKKICLGAVTLLIYGITLSPFIAKNYSAFHSPFPQGPSSTMFLTTYEDFHAYGKTLNWATYSQQGFHSIIKNKFHVAQQNLSQVESFLLPFFVILILAGIIHLFFAKEYRKKILFLLPSAVFAITEYLFYTFIASFSGPGSLPKALAILIPFLYIPFADLLVRFSKSKSAITIVCVILCIYSGIKSYQMIYPSIDYYNKMYQVYNQIRTVILSDTEQNNQDPNNIVIMTRDPWDVYEGTGFKAIMIPNNDLETIYFIAHYYRVGYILLPAPRIALGPIYSGKITDARFAFLTTIKDTPDKIFRIAQTP